MCNRQVEDWLFLHLSVIEASMNKLQSSLSSAYLHRQTFVSATHQAVAQFQQVGWVFFTFCCFYCIIIFFYKQTSKCMCPKNCQISRKKRKVSRPAIIITVNRCAFLFSNFRTALIILNNRWYCIEWLYFCV